MIRATIVFTLLTVAIWLVLVEHPFWAVIFSAASLILIMQSH
jgi:hypothetical protein